MSWIEQLTDGELFTLMWAIRCLRSGERPAQTDWITVGWLAACAEQLEREITDERRRRAE